MDREKRITGMPRDWRAETASSRTFLRRPMIAMDAPCLPNWVEISNPIPEPPPVSRATLPLSTSGLKGESIPDYGCDCFLIEFGKRRPNTGEMDAFFFEKRVRSSYTVCLQEKEHLLLSFL
ncbi:UNVERIFIED_CONTAM: hypothetical protein Sradi_5361000 [Sesamum radiatum]|uniref:Uncharacterized protein n=1 Tax=Sesamum radiatum TaxID=300843 RepID=A0AAW2LRJ2_SESRA